MPAPESRTFTFDGKFAFLTYPRSGGLTRERLRDFLEGNLGADGVHIARELHSDGTPHLHALVRWPNRRRFTGERTFDCDGRHPNVTKPRSTKHVAEYIAKSGLENVLSTFEPGELDDVGVTSKWGELLAEPDERSFLRRAEELCPREFVLYHARLREFCADRYGRTVEPYTGRRREQFREPESLREWVSESLERPRIERPRALLLVSPTRWGKTQWARSLEPDHIYMCNLFSSDAIRKGVTGPLILDDIDFRFFYHIKAVVGAQRDWYVTDKYRHKIRVDGGWPAIILCNEDNDPRGTLSGALLRWFAGNCKVVELTEPLFNSNS